MFDPDRRHLIAYIAAAAVLVVIAVRFVGRDSGSAPAASISMAAPASASPARARPRSTSRAKLIWIDVAGAVRRPGLYSLPEGARVAAAIQRAGGVRSRANRAAVNLAAKLTDGQQIFVPDRRPGAAGVGAGQGASGAATGGSGAAAGGAGAAAGGAGAAAGGSGPAIGGSDPNAGASGPSASAPISLSSASQAELEQLDGIGPALAQRIIQYREQHGGFRSIDELQQVSGIGAKRFEALKDSIAP